MLLVFFLIFWNSSISFFPTSYEEVWYFSKTFLSYFYQRFCRDMLPVFLLGLWSFFSQKLHLKRSSSESTRISLICAYWYFSRMPYWNFRRIHRKNTRRIKWKNSRRKILRRCSILIIQEKFLNQFLAYSQRDFLHEFQKIYAEENQKEYLDLFRKKNPQRNALGTNKEIVFFKWFLNFVHFFKEMSF